MPLDLSEGMRELFLATDRDNAEDLPEALRPRDAEVVEGDDK